MKGLMWKGTVVWRWLEENWTRKFAIKQVGKGQISAAKRWRKKLTFSEADVIGNVTYEGLTFQKSTSLSFYGGSLAEPCLLVWYHAIWHFRDLLLCTLRVSRCFSEAVVLRTKWYALTSGTVWSGLFMTLKFASHAASCPFGSVPCTSHLNVCNFHRLYMVSAICGKSDEGSYH